MKVFMELNGIGFEVDCTPKEFNEILGTLIPRQFKAQPEQSFSKLYSQALGMSLIDFVSLNRERSDTELIAEIRDKCSTLDADQPSDDRIRQGVETARSKL